MIEHVTLHLWSVKNLSISQSLEKRVYIYVCTEPFERMVMNLRDAPRAVHHGDNFDANLWYLYKLLAIPKEEYPILFLSDDERFQVRICH